MKLKILLAPFMIVMSVIILIWFAWPAFQELGKNQQELNTQKSELENILLKKNNIQKMKNSLDQNQEKENFISSYLPIKKNEEKIVNSVNFLAASSQVTLINVNFEKSKAVEEKTAEIDASLSISDTNQPGVSAKKKIKYYNCIINISGGYENIVSFINKLNKMEFLNKMIDIQVKSDVKDDIQTISSEIVAEFGFLSPVSLGNDFSDPIFSVQNLNFESVDKIQKSMVEKAPNLEEGAKGRSNPFAL